MIFQVVLWACFGLALITPALFDMYARHRRKRMWSLREHMSADRIFRTFYEKRGLDRHLVEPAWRELNYALGLSEGCMRPFDDLKQLSGYYARPFDSLNHRLELVIRCYLEPGEPIELNFETIDEVILFISQKWRERVFQTPQKLQRAHQAA